MTDHEHETYSHEAYSLLNEHMYEHATVEALLGIAYELRTANLLALDHTLLLMAQQDPVGFGDEDLETNIQTQIAQRLGLPTEPTP